MTTTIRELRSNTFITDLGETCVASRRAFEPLPPASSAHSKQIFDPPQFSAERESRTTPSHPEHVNGKSSSINTSTEDAAHSNISTFETSAPEDNSSVCQLVRQLLLRSGYPLAKIDCQCFDHSLALSGSVTQYYHLQVALEIAKQSAGGRQLDIQIQVENQSPPQRPSAPA